MASDPQAADRASSGHKLGQMVGDWFEEYLMLPLLQRVAQRLGLYLDHRFKNRPARGEKIIWLDEDGNEVAYDFVMEVGGTDEARGFPVAFFEGCWRRGTRHSKDKARDDSGKLLPMRETYPTARFLGTIVGGDFTQPSREFLQSRGIDLLYIPKAKIVAAFNDLGLRIDYPDKLPEEEKARIETAFSAGFKPEAKSAVAQRLFELIGNTTVEGYVDRVSAALRALPQEIRFIARRDSAPQTFETVEEASAFLDKPTFDFSSAQESFVYQITFSDGTEFERCVCSLEELRALHGQISGLITSLASMPK